MRERQEFFPPFFLRFVFHSFWSPPPLSLSTFFAHSLSLSPSLQKSKIEHGKTHQRPRGLPGREAVGLGRRLPRAARGAPPRRHRAHAAREGGRARAHGGAAALSRGGRYFSHPPVAVDGEPGEGGRGLRGAGGRALRRGRGGARVEEGRAAGGGGASRCACGAEEGEEGSGVGGGEESACRCGEGARRRGASGQGEASEVGAAAAAVRREREKERERPFFFLYHERNQMTTNDGNFYISSPQARAQPRVMECPLLAKDRQKKAEGQNEVCAWVGPRVFPKSWGKGGGWGARGAAQVNRWRPSLSPNLEGDQCISSGGILREGLCVCGGGGGGRRAEKRKKRKKTSFFCRRARAKNLSSAVFFFSSPRVFRSTFLLLFTRGASCARRLRP